MMIKLSLTLLSALTVCFALSACGWKPPCSATAVTDPWKGMNLPVQQDAAVCVSVPDRFQAAHKGNREEVAKMYVDALEKGGWKTTRRDLGDRYYYDFDKGSDKITVEIYDWEKTGVLIKNR